MISYHTLRKVLVLWVGAGLWPAYAATDCANVTEIPQSECVALLEVFNSTGGPNWLDNSGWNVTDAPCGWKGVTSCSGGYVTELFLSLNKLSGAIPDFSGLPNLQGLYLSRNQLSGAIPDFSGLPNLKFLSLYENQLSGAIPDFSDLPNLQGLSLDNNQLSGAIPDFSGLPNLLELYLYNNQLSGAIPDFSGLPNLQGLYLSRNQLSGAIPDFSGLPNLQSLNLSNNQLSGAIPDFSGLPNLQYLYLWGNQLSGTIPDFSDLPNLQILLLIDNKLSGAIPDFSGLPNLAVLKLYNNQLCGEIPTSLSTLSLYTLRLNNNSLTLPTNNQILDFLNSIDAEWLPQNPSPPTCGNKWTPPTQDCKALRTYKKDALMGLTWCKSWLKEDDSTPYSPVCDDSRARLHTCSGLKESVCPHGSFNDVDSQALSTCRTPVDLVSSTQWKSMSFDPPIPSEDVCSLNTGWTQMDYDDSQWRNACISRADKGKKLGDGIENRIGGAAIWDCPDGSNSYDGFSGPEVAYFRHTFFIDDEIESAYVELTVDDNFKFYINGQLVVEHTEENDGASPVVFVDTTPYLQPGKNVFAVLGWDGYGCGSGTSGPTDRSYEGFAMVGRITGIKWILLNSEELIVRASQICNAGDFFGLMLILSVVSEGHHRK